MFSRKTRKSLEINHPLLESLRKDLIWFLKDNFSQKNLFWQKFPEKRPHQSRENWSHPRHLLIFPKISQIAWKRKFLWNGNSCWRQIFPQKLKQFLLKNDLKPWNCEFSFTKPDTKVTCWQMKADFGWNWVSMVKNRPPLTGNDLKSCL